MSKPRVSTRCVANGYAAEELIDAYGSDDGHGPIDIIERAKALVSRAKGTV